MRFTPAAFALAIVSFFLPFITVSCSDHPVETLTGVQLAFGVPSQASAPAQQTDSSMQPSTFTEGREAEVVTDNAPIIADRANFGRLLSRCSSGTDVIVVGETGSFYAVEMADRSLGYMLKADARLLNNQVTLQLPATTQSSQVSTPPNDSSTGQGGQPLVAWAFVLTVAGLGFAVLTTMGRKKWRSVVIVPSIICIALLLIFKSELDNAYAAEVVKVPIIQLNYDAGLWLCLVSYGMAIMLAMCPANTRSTISSVSRNVIDQLERAE